jgi:predicted small lipoprotein YifL
MKRVVSMLLAFIMMATLCACGNQESAEVQAEAVQTAVVSETVAVESATDESRRGSGP